MTSTLTVARAVAGRARVVRLVDPPRALTRRWSRRQPIRKPPPIEPDPRCAAAAGASAGAGARLKRAGRRPVTRTPARFEIGELGLGQADQVAPDLPVVLAEAGARPSARPSGFPTQHEGTAPVWRTPPSNRIVDGDEVALALPPARRRRCRPRCRRWRPGPSASTQTTSTSAAGLAEVHSADDAVDEVRRFGRPLGQRGEPRILDQIGDGPMARHRRAKLASEPATMQM